MTMRETDFSLKENFQGGAIHGQVLQITHLGDYTPDYKITTQPGLGLLPEPRHHHSVVFSW